ncbi:MAG TPA: hypothetical protein PKY99_00220 [Turneriella sp.]|nr:hypothetical protein [Turneriella sp.]
MAADIEKLLVQIRADLSDLKKLQVELATIKKQGQDAAQGITAAFGNAVGNVAKVFGAVKIKGVFDSAVADARALEKTILGLQATAKLTGNNFQELNASVKNLAKDGVLSIDQASQSMKVLLAQGLSANKAFELVDAAKKVGAFNNIVGNTGQAVQDFIKFLQTGSAELAENLDPSLVKVIKSLGGYEKVANNAEAKQQLINAVIQKGKDLNADYAKFLDSGAQAQVNLDNASKRLSQTFGEKLAPAYNAIQNALAKVIGYVADLVAGFDSTTVAIVASAGLIVLSLHSISGALGLVSTSAGAAWAALVGPLTIVVAVVGAAAAAFAKLHQYWNESFQSRLEKGKSRYRAEADELKKLGDTITELQKTRNRTIAQEEQLRASHEQLRKKARELGIDYDELVKKVGGYANALKELDRASRGKEADEGTRVERRKLDSALRQQARLQESTKGLTPEARNRILEKANAEVVRTTEEFAKAHAAFFQEDEIKKAAQASLTGTGPAKPEARYIETRDELLKGLSEFERTIKIIDAREVAALERLRNPKKIRDAYTGREESDKEYNKRRADFLKSGEFKQQQKEIQERAGFERKDASAKLNEAFENNINALQESQAQFLEEKAIAELKQIEQQHNLQIANVYKLANARKLSEGEVEAELDKLRRKNAEKQQRVYIQSFTDTLSSAGALAGAVGAFRSAARKGDAGGQITAVGSAIKSGADIASKFTDKLGNAGPIGQAIAVGGQLVSAVAGLFGKSDEEIKNAAKEQAERDALALRLFELQAEYQKRMLAIQEANAKLPFENLQRQLRLVDIGTQRRRLAGEDSATIERDRLQQRQQLITTTLQSQSGAIAGGQLFTNTVANAEGLTTFLSERAAQDPYVGAFVDYANRALGSVGSIQELQAYFDNMQSLSGNVPQALATAGLNAVAAKIGNFWRQFAVVDTQSVRNRTSFENRQRFITGALLSANYGTGGIAIDEDNEGFYDIGRIGDTGLGAVNALASEIRSDTVVAENILSVIETDLENSIAIKDFTKQTAENTKKLEQLDPRKISFLDLVRNSVFSRGLTIDYSNVQLPSTVTSTVLASTISPAVPSDTLSALRRLVELSEEANDYLAVIAENTNKNSTDDVDISDNRLVGRINNIRSRSIS